MKMWRPDGWKELLRKHGVYQADAFGRVKANAGADAMYEPAYKKGQRDLIERYKRENPSAYKKYQAYWDSLSEEVE